MPTTIVCVAYPVTTRKKRRPFEVEIPAGLAITGVVLVDHVESLEAGSGSLHSQHD